MDIVISVEFFGDEGEADLVRWLVSEGDLVKEGQPIAELETSKTIQEFRSPAAGAISLNSEEGDTVSAESVIATIALESP